jgi:hypothetical protein
MRTLLFLLLGAVSAFPEAFQVGVKAGVPLTDFFTTVQSPRFGFNSSTKRYIIGGTAQLNLPAGFALEFDALYRRLNYESSSSALNALTTSSTTGNAWEFPLLLKYRFPTPIARPYVEGGVAWDTLSGLKQSVTSAVGISTTSTPAELRKSTITGVVLGAGVDVKALFVHIVPGIRYTHWGSTHFRDVVNDLLHSNQNQAEFLVGFTF